MKDIKITREQFNADLFSFATKWTVGTQEKIIEQADELFENPATRYMIHCYAVEKEHHDNAQKKFFSSKLKGEDSSSIYRSEVVASHERVAKYASTLYELIIS